jgi:uncharacterized membrane protein HdeD (DUF308 family)
MPLKHISIFTFGILLILGGILELVQGYAFILDIPSIEVFLFMTVGLFLTIYGALPMVHCLRARMMNLVQNPQM